MWILKSIMRIIVRFLAGFIIFVGIYLAAAYSLPYFHGASVQAAGKDIEVFVRSNGIHTDIIFPVNKMGIDFRKKIPYSDFQDADSSSEYLAAGWGDKGFYLDTKTWDDLRWSTALKAVSGLDGTAMHIFYHRKRPVCDDLCRKLVLSKQQYLLLASYVFSSFRYDHGNIMLIDHPGYGSNDRFYEAVGNYSMFRTCNVWTGQALRAAGVQLGPWTPFHRGVIDHCAE